MAYRSEDADVILADFGVPVTTSGVPAGVLGLLDQEILSKDGASAEHDIARPILSLKPGALGTLTMDQLISVSGVPYRVRGPVPGPVGLFERYELAESAA